MMARPASSGFGVEPVVKPIRLMLVDDSAVARSIFQRMLAPHRDFHIVATADSADSALAMLPAVPVDVILLDLEMPGTDGLTALPQLIAKSGARVLIVSSSCEVGGAAAMRALTLGAADTLPKPGAGSFGGRFADILAETLRRVASAPRVTGQPGEGASQPLSLRKPVSGPIGCIAIGASTGGLPALSDFFHALPLEVAVPILLTQHLPAAFMPYFAAQIQSIAGRRARVAQEGDSLDASAVLIAPGDAHLRLIRGTDAGIHITLDHGHAPSGCMPSVDPMFDSVAGLFGVGAVGVVLSGMGRDGARAAGRLADMGGEVLVQDVATAEIWGMPGAVALAGDASGVIEPAAIARRIARRHAAAMGVPLREAMLWR